MASQQVQQSFVDEQIHATDDVIDTLDAIARLLKSDKIKAVQRHGFGLQDITSNITRWQREFRRAVKDHNENGVEDDGQ